jgi:hypothetical protein
VSRHAWIFTAIALGASLAGCANPDAATRVGVQAPSPASPGEPAPPTPTPPSADAPVGVRGTPQAALAAFAGLYVNWDYRTLTSRQRELAGMSVGSARAAELQATASSRDDTTIAAAHIANSGTVLSISPEQGGAGTWVIVTREQTSGSGDYEGLAAADHVTIARLARSGGGYAVSEWLPQS